MIENTDLYAGYEEEPEIIFQVIKDEKVIKTLHIWDGHLLFIVENSLKTEMGWKGISCAYYNGDLEEEWIANNLQECLDDLHTTNIDNLDEETKTVHKALLDIFKYAINTESIVKIINN